MKYEPKWTTQKGRDEALKRAIVKSKFKSVNNLTGYGYAPEDALDLGKVRYGSDKATRSHQLLREMSTQFLNLSKVGGGQPVELQGMFWRGSLFFTANVGEAVKAIRKEFEVEGRTLGSVLLTHYEISGDPDGGIRSLRHARKLFLVMNTDRRDGKLGKDEDRRIQALLKAYRDQKPTFINATAISNVDPSTPGVYFVTHEHTKDGRTMRHAEHILTETVESGTAIVSGAKIPCFACYIEFLVRKEEHPERFSFMDYCGTFYKNATKYNEDDLTTVKRIHRTIDEWENSPFDVYKIPNDPDSDSEEDDDRLDIEKREHRPERKGKKRKAKTELTGKVTKKRRTDSEGTDPEKQSSNLDDRWPSHDPYDGDFYTPPMLYPPMTTPFGGFPLTMMPPGGYLPTSMPLGGFLGPPPPLGGPPPPTGLPPPGTYPQFPLSLPTTSFFYGPPIWPYGSF